MHNLKSLIGKKITIEYYSDIFRRCNSSLVYHQNISYESLDTIILTNKHLKEPMADSLIKLVVLSIAKVSNNIIKLYLTDNYILEYQYRELFDDILCYFEKGGRT